MGLYVSLTDECRNWDCDHAIPVLGIFVSNFWHWFFAVQEAGKRPKVKLVVENRLVRFPFNFKAKKINRCLFDKTPQYNGYKSIPGVNTRPLRLTAL